MQRVAVQTQISTKTSLFHERLRWRDWRRRNWRRRMEWIHEKKHSYGTWKDESSQHPMLDWNTQGNDVSLGNENCIATRWTIGKESNRMEPLPLHQASDKQTSGKTKKDMGRCIKWLLHQARGNWRDEKGNEIKINDTWIEVADTRDWWKQWKVNTQRQQLQHLLTVCTESVDRHSVWTAWSWMYTRWWTSRSHSPRTRRTLIDTAAEPRHEGWWA